MGKPDYILIKGMVCLRCIAMIKDGLEQMGYSAKSISLGKVAFEKVPEPAELQQIKAFLTELGFDHFSERSLRLVEGIKEIVEEVLNQEEQPDKRLKFSTVLSDRLHLNYDSLSALFTEAEGITLERYIINRRLEKVMRLLANTALTFTEIAYRTGFSSVQHLSKQFKELTGMSPSAFRLVKVQ